LEALMLELRFMPWFRLIATRAHSTARSKGWWDPCLVEGELSADLVEGTVLEKIALVHSELSEALEDLRVGRLATVESDSGKPEGAISELADVVIRVGDLWGALMGAGLIEEPPVAEVPGVFIELNKGSEVPIADKVALLHAALSLAVIQGRGIQAPGQLAAHLLSFVMAVRIVADDLGADHNTTLHDEVKRKMAYNLTRSHRHGGKVF
jgi:hypothetical protein